MHVERLFDIPYHQLETAPQATAIATMEGKDWRVYSTKELIDTSERIALGLLALGVGPGDRVAIASGNRSEWCLVDHAVLQLGAIVVPIYPTSSVDDYVYIAEHSGFKVGFSSNAEIHDKMVEARKMHGTIQHLFTFDEVAGVERWTSVLKQGESGDTKRLAPFRDAVKASDMATIIYTSGTTGRPKGVMLTHANILSNVIASTPRLPVDSSAKCISFLPLSHIYERMLMYLYMKVGVSIHFQESLDDLGDRIRDVSPHVFTAVPRLLEKIYDKIVAKGEALTGVKRALFFWALDLGHRYDVNGKGPWYAIQLWLARKLIFSKWQAALGGNVRVVASGSAALQPRLARVFTAAGIPIMEGYGLTETSPVCSVNEQDNNGLRFGTVGRPLKDVLIRIAEDGEILVKGPNVMVGYYKDPEKTAEVLTADGWFHTGDIGELDADGFLKITDRKKEIFKTSGGKYVAPQVLENKLKASRFVEQVMVIGEGQKFPAALIVPSFPFLKDYCALKNIPYEGPEQIISDQRIKERVMAEVKKANEGLGNWETVKKIALLPKEWSIEAGELTPTMKLRRKTILANSSKEVESIYGPA